MVRPTITRIVVVLPAPLGPRKPVTRPGRRLERDVVDGREVAVRLREGCHANHARQPAAPTAPPGIGRRARTGPYQSRGRSARRPSLCGMDRPTPEETQPALTLAQPRLAAGRLRPHLGAGLVARRSRASWSRDRTLFWVEIALRASRRTSWSSCGAGRRSPSRWSIALLSTFSGIAAGPATLAAVSVATQRVAWSVIAVGRDSTSLAATAYTFYAPIELRDPSGSRW